MPESFYQVKTTKSVKFLETTKKVFPLVKDYYVEAAKVQADRSKKVGYVQGDPRDYADAQVKNRIEGFMEMLAARKQKSQPVPDGRPL